MGTIANLMVKLGLDSADFAAGMSKAAGQMQQAGQKMSGMGKSLTAGVTLPIVGIGIAALQSAGDFEQTMNVMQQVGGATAAEMESLSAAALKLGAESVFSAGEVADAQLELAKAGMEVNDVLASSAGVVALAAAADIDLAEAAMVSSDAITSFNLPASDAGKIADLLAAAANSSTASVNDMAKALQMSSSVMSQYGFTAEETVTILGQLANAGIRNSDAGTSLKVAMMKLAAPTDTAIAALQEYGISVYDSNGAMRDARSIFIDFIKNMSVGAEKTQMVGLASKEMTKAAEKAQGAIGPLTNRIEEQKAKLNILNQELVATVEKYGQGSTQAQNKQLAITKLTNSLAENQAKYGELAGAISTYENTQASAHLETTTVTEEMRNQALATIFGTDAVRTMNVIMAQGVEGFDDMYDAVTKAGAAQEVADARMKGFAGAIEYFKGTLDTVLIQAGTPWLDMLGNMLRSVADLIAKFGELPASLQQGVVIFLAILAAVGPLLILFGTLTSSIGTIVGALALVSGPVWLIIAAVAALAIAFATNFMGIRDMTMSVVGAVQGLIMDLVAGNISAGEALASAWSKIKEAGTQAFGLLVDFIQKQLPVWIATFVGWRDAAWQWIVAAIPIIQSKAQQIFDVLVDYIQKQRPSWSATFADWRDAAWEWIVTAVPIVLTKAGEYATILLQFLGNQIPNLLAMMLRYATAIVDWIGNAQSPVTSSLGDWISNILQWGLGVGLPALIGLTLQFAWALIKWIAMDLIPKVAPELLKFGLALLTALAKLAGSLAMAALDIGIGIIKGIVQGIMSGVGAIANAAKNVAIGALDAAKWALGINSPSTVAADEVGEPFGEGIGVGARRTIDDLTGSLGSRLDALMGGLQPAPGFAGEGAGPSGMTIQVTQNFYGQADAATVEGASRNGVVAALRQVGVR